MGTVDDDRHVGQLLLDGGDQVLAGHARELEIGHQHVGLERAAQPQPFFGGVGLTDDGDVTGQLEHGDGEEPDVRLVLDNDDTTAAGRRGRDPRPACTRAARGRTRPMQDRTRRRWFENAVLYSLDIATFADGNDDGMGDVLGLIDRLDYLHALGVEALWLAPFLASPNRDNRYDVADHYAIDPQLGDFGDITRLLRECDQRGIRVIVELIVNHTSVDHPWFQEARP